MPLYLCRNSQRRLKCVQLLTLVSKHKHTCRQKLYPADLTLIQINCRKCGYTNFHNKPPLLQSIPTKCRLFSTTPNLCSGIGYKIKDNFKDCCFLLGVSEDCSMVNLKEAYIRKAKLYHPDSGSSTADPSKFDQVRDAYQTVKERLEENAVREGLVPDKDEEEEEDLFSTRLQPQHRQYLDKQGIGYGTQQERQKQYEQFRVSKAQSKVYTYKIRRLTPEGETALVTKDKRATRRNKIRSEYELDDPWLQVRIDRKNNSMDRIVEDLIQEAMSRGDFRDLDGAGKPLKREQEAPYMDKVTSKLNQILINESTQPEWIMMQKEIRNDIDTCRQKLAMELKHLGDPPYTGDNLQHYTHTIKLFHITLLDINTMIDKNDIDTCRQKFAIELKHLGDPPYTGDNLQHYTHATELFHTTLLDINTMIDKFNLICPVMSKQMVPYQFARERDKVCSDPDRFLPPDFSLKPKTRGHKALEYSDVESVSMKQVWSDFKDIFRKS